MRKSGSSYNNSEGLKKGAWTADEDQIVKDYVKSHGVGKWGKLSRETGLKRCGKSVRLRWLNYLRPDIVRGNITKDEEDLIIRLHKLLGNRWSLIAGRIPGRTDNEIKNYWHSCLRKKKVHQENRSQVMPRKEIHICREIMSSSAAVAASADEGNPHLTGSNVDNGDEYHHRRKPDDCNGSGDDDLWWNSFIMNLNDVQLDVSEFQSNNFPEIWESEMDVFDAARHCSTDNIYHWF